MVMWQALLGLIDSLFGTYLSAKSKDAQLYGESVEQTKERGQTIVLLNKEMQAQTDAPKTKDELVKSLRNHDL